MIRYLCDTCGTAFDEPLRRSVPEHIGGFPSTCTEILCPICGSEHFSDGNECPSCGRGKPAADILCRLCRQKLLRRFTAFADCLTAEEEEQVDRWVEGSSITDRRRWT